MYCVHAKAIRQAQTATSTEPGSDPPGDPASGAFGQPRVYGFPIPCSICHRERRAFSVSRDGVPECVACVGELRRRTALVAFIEAVSIAERRAVDAPALRVLRPD